MKEKAGWAAPSVAFGPGALFVTFLAGVVVKLLLANPEATSEGLLPVPLATRAADSAAGLDFLENNAADATNGAVGAALGDTEEPTVKTEKAKSDMAGNAHVILVVMNGCNLQLCWDGRFLCSGI